MDVIIAFKRLANEIAAKSTEWCSGIHFKVESISVHFAPRWKLRLGRIPKTENDKISAYAAIMKLECFSYNELDVHWSSIYRIVRLSTDFLAKRCLLTSLGKVRNFSIKFLFLLKRQTLSLLGCFQYISSNLQFLRKT